MKLDLSNIIEENKLPFWGASSFTSCFTQAKTFSSFTTTGLTAIDLSFEGETEDALALAWALFLLVRMRLTMIRRAGLSIGVDKLVGNSVTSLSNFLSFSELGLNSSRCPSGRVEMCTAANCVMLVCIKQLLAWMMLHHSLLTFCIYPFIIRG